MSRNGRLRVKSKYNSAGEARAIARSPGPACWPGAIGNDYFLALPLIAFSTTSLGRDAAFNKALRAVEPA